MGYRLSTNEYQFVHLLNTGFMSNAPNLCYSDAQIKTFISLPYCPACIRPQETKMYKKLLITALLISLTACTNKPTKTEKASADSQLTDAELEQVITLLGQPQKVDASKIDKFPLGSKENPVRVGGPEGQRNYLSRLICDNNEQVSVYGRLGSSDIGPYGTIMDIYEVICDTDKGAVKHEVFLDMYHHKYIESRPAAGFIALKPNKK
jgi:hypothetical protein